MYVKLPAQDRTQCKDDFLLRQLSSSTEELVQHEDCLLDKKTLQILTLFISVLRHARDLSACCAVPINKNY